MDYVPVTPAEFADLEGLDDWRYALGEIHAEFLAASFPAAGALINQIIEAAEAADHHPDLELRFPGRVWVSMSTHATRGLTMHDVELARAISALAAEAGATAGRSRAQAIEFAIDTMDANAIRPFWAAIMGYEDRADDNEVVDPRGRGPTLWFQQLDEPRAERSRFHIDVSVPHDEADDRIAAAVAAGGRLVSDRRARAFWILADADGNEACVCTWQDR